MQRFIRDSFHFFELLSEHPHILERSIKQKNVHRGPLNNHTILTYRFKPGKKQIELLNIRSSKQEPRKKLLAISI